MDVADEDDPFEEQREQVDNAMARLFLEYGRRYTFQFVVGLVSSVVARALDLLPPLLLGVAIDAVIRDERAFDLPLVPEAVEPASAAGQIWFMAGLIAVSFFGGASIHWTRNWGWNSFAQNIQHDIRTETYNKMQRLNMGFFADKQTGEMMSVLS
ncbi:MAG: ABC transporter transmembrane domain-containing protein, partial [Haloarculaceae archaeon]